MAHLTIERRQADRVVILDFKGTLTLGADGENVRATMRSLLEAGEKQILINMAEVGYMDSSGLGYLVSAFTTAKRQDAVVKLTNLSHRVDNLLQITKLLTVFETFENEGEAVASFQATPTATTSSTP